MKKRLYYTQYFIVLSVIIVLVSTDLYIPSMPLIVETFSSSYSVVQTTLSANLIGLSLSGLIFGSLSDLYGRRSMMLCAMGILVTSLFVCAFSANIHMFILGRFFQGCGGGGIITISLAMIKDLFVGVQLAKFLSKTTFLYTFSPTLAPVIGGYISTHFGWHTSFIATGITSFIMLILMFLFLKDSLSLERRKRFQDQSHRQYFRKLLRMYSQALKTKGFMKYIIFYSMLFLGKWCFITVAPFIFINQYHFSMQLTGYYISSTLIGYMLGALFMQFAIYRFNAESLVQWGYVLASFASFIFLFVNLVEAAQPAILCAIMMLYVTGIGIVLPSSTTLIMDIFGQKLSGVCASLLSTIRSAAGALGTGIGILLMGGDLVNVGLFMVLTVLIPIVLWLKEGHLTLRIHKSCPSEDPSRV